MGKLINHERKDLKNKMLILYEFVLLGSPGHCWDNSAVLYTAGTTLSSNISAKALNPVYQWPRWVQIIKK